MIHMQMHSYLLTGTFPWGGIRYAGRVFNSQKLLKAIQENGQHILLDACQNLDVLPYDDELNNIVNYIEEHEVKH
jgi:hypothetical protein